MYSKLTLLSFILLLLNSCSKTIEDYSIEENENLISLTEECKKIHFQNYIEYAKANLKLEIKYEPLKEKKFKHFYDSKINLKRIKEFEKIDTNFLQQMNYPLGYNYTLSSLLAPTIIEGTILKVEDIHIKNQERITKSHKVRVNKIFKKGKSWKGNKTIEVRTGIYKLDVPQDYGEKGEDVLLFLNSQREMYNYENADLKAPYWIMKKLNIDKINSVYTINGMNKDSVYQKIKLIHQINNLNDFINDFLEEECM